MNRKTTALLATATFVVGMGVGTFAIGDGTSTIVSKFSESKEVKASEDENIAKIQKAYEIIANQYVKKIDPDKLTEGAIQGMVTTLDDPFSTYMDGRTAKQFHESLGSSFQGIGAEVSKDGDKLIIVSPIKNSPAEKAGLKPKDEILSVDGKSVKGLSQYDAVLKIRGKKGTNVTIEVQRPGVSDPIKFTIKRDDIPMYTVFSSVKDVNNEKIGYIHITSFNEKTADEFKKELKKLEDQNIQGLTIDVRGNPGGYLQAVEGVLGELVVKSDPYLQVENRNGQREKYYTKLNKAKPYPIDVLIDKGSASAAEILAAALSEAGHYELIGEKSYGKGTVQSTLDFKDGSNIKLTQFKWLTPDGTWIHKKGIKPDVAVKQPDYFYATPIDKKKTFKFDDNDENIKQAQIMLKGLGYDPGRKDGYFSKQTETAVKNYQKAVGITVNGKIDPLTSEKLESSLIDKIKDEKNDLQLEKALDMVAQ
ncbi:S41 family peptidase [Gottfriedia sp. NPDC057991]|uniref:S41 family peptidase n=1 Tax=Gottfriedia sp. NPDC057991 TaxID=3346298 RepID=UPI0036DE1F90